MAAFNAIWQLLQHLKWYCFIKIWHTHTHANTLVLKAYKEKVALQTQTQRLRSNSGQRWIWREWAITPPSNRCLCTGDSNTTETCRVGSLRAPCARFFTQGDPIWEASVLLWWLVLDEAMQAEDRNPGRSCLPANKELPQFFSSYFL